MAPFPFFKTYRQPAPNELAPCTQRSFSSVLRRYVPACLLAFMLGISGCAHSGGKSVDWQLSSEGERLYYHLVQLEAMMSGDERAFEDSGKKLLELDPDESTFLDMAEFALRRRRLEEARIIARKGLEVFPSSLPLALSISDSYLQQDNPRDAAGTLVSFVKTNPNNQEAVQELARAYLMGEQYGELHALLRSLPEKRMTPYMRYIKGRSLLNRNQPVQAERELRRVVRAQPDMAEAWMNLAIAVQKQGRYKEAFPLYRSAIDLAPDNLALRLRLIDAQLRGKRPDLAAQSVAEVPSPAFQMEAAMLFVEMKHLKAARSILSRVKTMPGAPEEVSLYLAAIVLEYENNMADALAELAHIQPESPLADRALRWRLQLLEKAGRSKDAVTVAREFAERNPDAPAFHIVYAQACAVAGDPATSVAILRKARKQWPDELDVAFYLASFLDAIKDKEEAMQLMEFVLARQPRNALALNYVGYTLADEGRDLDKALDLLQRAVAEAPDDPHIADSLAWVLYRQGNYRDAWQAITKSISLGGDHPVIWEHYGDIAAKMGNRAEARKGYANALKQNPENPEAIKTKQKSVQ